MSRPLDAGAWDGLFDFLDPTRREKVGASRDREAEERFREITRKLVCFFAGRGCRDAEDLAADTVLRVASKCQGIARADYADATGYFYGVARNVFHEWVRDTKRESTKRESLRLEEMLWPLPDPRSTGLKEAMHRRLEQCLRRLTRQSRRLILDYYRGEKSAKAEAHQQLATEFGKSVNALRIEVHRIRKVLRECVFGLGTETFSVPRPL